MLLTNSQSSHGKRREKQGESEERKMRILSSLGFVWEDHAHDQVEAYVFFLLLLCE